MEQEILIHDGEAKVKKLVHDIIEYVTQVYLDYS